MCFRKPKLTLYKKPACVQCDATVRALGDTEYEVVDLTQDEDALAAVKELGYQQAPVVVCRLPSGEETHWSGFQPSRINDYKAAARNWGRDDS